VSILKIIQKSTPVTIIKQIIVINSNIIFLSSNFPRWNNGPPLKTPWVSGCARQF